MASTTTSTRRCGRGSRGTRTPTSATSLSTTLGSSSAPVSPHARPTVSWPSRRNWEGSLAANGAVDGTLALWREMEAAAPELEANWRWQMHLMRAYYDAYTRHRLIHETRLESDALDVLAAAPALGAGSAMDRAAAILGRASSDNCCPAWRKRIEALCDALFGSDPHADEHGEAFGQRLRARGRARLRRPPAQQPLVARGPVHRSPRPARRGGAARAPAHARRVDPARPRQLLRRYGEHGGVAARAAGRFARAGDPQPGGSDTALHLGGRPEPHASVVAHQPALAQGDRLPPSGSRCHLSGAAQRDQAEGAR